MLKRYHHDPSHIISYEEMQVQANITYEELSVEILSWTNKVLRNKRIFMMKV